GARWPPTTRPGGASIGSAWPSPEPSFLSLRPALRHTWCRPITGFTDPSIDETEPVTAFPPPCGGGTGGGIAECPKSDLNHPSPSPQEGGEFGRRLRVCFASTDHRLAPTLADEDAAASGSALLVRLLGRPALLA